MDDLVLRYIRWCHAHPALLNLVYATTIAVLVMGVWLVVGPAVALAVLVLNLAVLAGFSVWARVRRASR